MNGSVLSEHRLVSMDDYSIKGKLKSILIGWGVFLVIFFVTRVPDIQHSLLSFARDLAVTWITSWINFFINGLWIMFIPLTVGTVLTLSQKQRFDALAVYENGVGFRLSGEERFVPYGDIRLSYGRMQEGFFIESKAHGLRLRSYGWREFSQPEILRSNLEKYGVWGN